MPGPSTIVANSGVASASILGNDGRGNTRASRLIAKQGWSTVSNYVDDRDVILPTGTTSVNAGDMVTFEIQNDHDFTSFVDLRLTLPGLVAATTTYDNQNIGSGVSPVAKNYNFPSQPANFCIDAAGITTIPWSTVAATTGPKHGVAAQSNYDATGSLDYVYRIPTPASFADLAPSSAYATTLGGYPNPTTPITTTLAGAGSNNAAFNMFDMPASLLTTPQHAAQAWEAPCPVWVDYVGYWLLEDIQVTHGSNEIMRFTGVDMWKMDLKWHNQEVTEHYREMTGGHQNGPFWDVTDVIAASYAKDIIVPLDFLFWVGKVTESLPIIGSGKPMTIKIKFRQPQFLYLMEKLLIRTRLLSDNGEMWDATNAMTVVPVPIRNVRLEIHQFHVPRRERAKVLGDLDTKAGYIWKSLDVERQDDVHLTQAQNNTKAAVPLVAFKNACTSLFISKIHAADKITPFKCFWTNFLRIKSFQVDSSKDNIIPATDHKYEQLRMSVLANNLKLSTYNVYAHNFSKVPMDKFNGWGHMEIGNLHNPTLTINYENDYSNPIYQVVRLGGTSGGTWKLTYNSTGSPITGNDHVLDILALTHQFVQQKSGEFTKSFA